MCNFSTSRGNQEKSIDIKDRKKKKNIRETRESDDSTDAYRMNENYLV